MGVRNAKSVVRSILEGKKSEIRYTKKYQLAYDTHIEMTLSCDEYECKKASEEVMAKALLAGNDFVLVAVYDIYSRNYEFIEDDCGEDIANKVRRLRMTEGGENEVDWFDIFKSLSGMYKAMLRVVSNYPGMPHYKQPRGYEYLDSFRRYFCNKHELSRKQDWVLQKKLFLEIAYSLCTNMKNDTFRLVDTNKKFFSMSYYDYKFRPKGISYFDIEDRSKGFYDLEVRVGDSISMYKVKPSSEGFTYELVSGKSVGCEDLVYEIVRYVNNMLGSVDRIIYRGDCGSEGDYLFYSYPRIEYLIERKVGV